MKKTLLAATLLAGFAGAAQAQSNVTLYGIADVGVSYTKVEGAQSRTAIDSGLQSQSRWGIRGVEDIGNGLKAIFQLENGFTIDNGNQLQGRLFGRYAFVGLDSAAAGRLIFGRTTTLGFIWAAPIVNPFGLGFGGSSVGTTFGYNEADLGGGRADNAVYYTTPNFSGFQGSVGYSFAATTVTAAGPQVNTPATEVAGNKNNDRLLNLGLKYDNGPLKAVVTYEYLNPDQRFANNGKLKNLTLGANYNFGVATVYAGYSNSNNIRTVAGWNGSIGATAANFTKDSAYTLGVAAPVGPGKIYAAWQKATKSKTNGWALGYRYDLSKRTNVYAFFANNEIRNFTTNKDLYSRQLAVGLQHNF